jgi:uncharacterized repeat protein (TIGR01451 family)
MSQQRLFSRTILTAIVAIGSIHAAPAQGVFVPDTNLRNALNAWVPGCVDAAGYLNPDDPDVQAQHSLTLQVDWTPADLTGVNALSSLDTLSIRGGYTIVDWGEPEFIPSDNGLISIPDWPSSLQSLVLDRGTWNVLPSFQAGLEALYMGVPGQPVIPVIPAGVTTLTVVDQATLSAFPGIPAGVEYLRLESHGNPFPTLPEGIQTLFLKSSPGVGLPSFPNSVDSLVLMQFDATTIPSWPDSAHSIVASNMAQVEQVAPFPEVLHHLKLVLFNTLDNIPPLPAGLEYLDLEFCDSLQAIPPFPNSLAFISLLQMPEVDSLPPWPMSVNSIVMFNLGVAALPDFPPGLEYLDINFLSSLSCLPVLPPGLTTLNIDADPLGYAPTAFTCIPNFPPNLLNFQWGSFGNTPQDPDLLCTALNSSCPFQNPVVTGTVYWDQNANGTRESGEPGYPFATLHQEPGAALHGVYADGSYTWPMPIGSYTLSASGNNPYVTGILPAQVPLSLANNGQVSTGNDFGVTLQPDVQDLRIDLMQLWSVPGLDAYGTITCSNVGSLPVDATVTLQLDTILEWVSGNPAPASAVGNTVSWTMPALQVGETRQIHVMVHTDEDVPLGTPVSAMAQVDPVASDATPLDNVSDFNSEVMGPYDPNDKLVLPAALSPADVSSGDHEVAYTIRFQNTGSWPAMNVVVLDSLSPELQWGSFRMVSSSHPCSWELTGNGVLTFRFEGINLPDSTNNEPLSHGFVKFAIKPATTLASGMSVANVADILFDFNAPVRTAPAVFSVADNAGIATYSRPMLQLYPNPAGQVLNVRLEQQGPVRVAVLDGLGRELNLGASRNAGTTTLRVDDLAPGVYFVRCITDAGTWSTKFVKR